LHVCRGHALGS